MDDSTPLQQSSGTTAAWQRAAADCVTTPEELLRLLDLDPTLPGLDFERRRRFPLRVPHAFVARMRRGDPQDPLFLQVWPSTQEGVETPGFLHDAVGELDRRSDGGVIRKYRGRALVITTSACAVHCRYCFRRHFPYGESLATRDRWKPTLATLAADSSINEVILSGGDPLSLTDDKLANLVQGLDSIPHLRRLRIHTRQPVMLPQRVDPALLGWLNNCRLQKWMVLHINHANEIDDSLIEACSRLRGGGVHLLNQSVLLRNVNDSVEALLALSERLSDAGILPYYLHMMDRVQGAAHFDVSEARAAAIMRALSASTSGYLVPRLVREIAGAPAKTGLSW